MNYKVSVIIPTVGERSSIINSIESIIAQENVNTEIIIVFDHIPVDPKLKATYKNITMIKNSGNKGGNACRNLGVSVAKSDIIAFLDDDDTWVNNKLFKQLEVMSKCSINTVVYTGKDIITISKSKTKSRYNFSKQTTTLAIESLARNNFVGSTSTILLNKSTFNKVKGFNESLDALQDYELYIRLAQCNVDFIGIDEPLVKYYIIQNNFSVSKKFSKNFNSSLVIYKLFKSSKNKMCFAFNTIIIYNIKVLIHKLRFI
jgi:glycosyltransferase involved in cell wall biosynthesis